MLLQKRQCNFYQEHIDSQIFDYSNKCVSSHVGASAILGVSALRVLKNYSIRHTFGSSMAKKFSDDS